MVLFVFGLGPVPAPGFEGTAVPFSDPPRVAPRGGLSALGPPAAALVMLPEHGSDTSAALTLPAAPAQPSSVSQSPEPGIEAGTGE